MRNVYLTHSWCSCCQNLLNKEGKKTAVSSSPSSLTNQLTHRILQGKLENLHSACFSVNRNLFFCSWPDYFPSCLSPVHLKWDKHRERSYTSVLMKLLFHSSTVKKQTNKKNNQAKKNYHGFFRSCFWPFLQWHFGEMISAAKGCWQQTCSFG